MKLYRIAAVSATASLLALVAGTSLSSSALAWDPPVPDSAPDSAPDDRPAGYSATPADEVDLTLSAWARTGDQAVRARTWRPVAVRIRTPAATPTAPAGSQVQGRVWVRTRWEGQPVTLVVRERSETGVVQTRRAAATLASRSWTPLTVDLVTEDDGSTLEVDVLAGQTDHVVDLKLDDLSLSATSTPAPTPPTPPVPPVPTGSGTLTNGCAYSPRGLPACGAYAGSAYGSNTDPTTVESQLGRRLGVRRTFWTAPQVDSAVDTARADVARGRLPWISFKVPHSWEAMTAGQGDAWARDLAHQLATVPGPVWLALHHEPEGDGNIDAWRTMQERLAPLIRTTAPNVAYTVVLTGWNQFFGDPQYSLANLWPRGVTIDVAGFDLYNEYGVTKNGRTITTWPDFDRDYFAPIQAWATRQGVAWGIAEAGYTDEGHARTPTWLDTTYRQLVARDGVAMAYFDTTLNAYGTWALGSASKRAAWAAAVRDSAALPVP